MRMNEQELGFGDLGLGTNDLSWLGDVNTWGLLNPSVLSGTWCNLLVQID